MKPALLAFVALVPCYCQSLYAQDGMYLETRSDHVFFQSDGGGTSSSRMLMATFSSDARYMGASVMLNRTTSEGTNMRNLGMLFDLENGNLVRTFKNATAVMDGDQFVLARYGEIWDRVLDPSKPEFDVVRNPEEIRMDPTTLQISGENTHDLPEGHQLTGAQGSYLASVSQDKTWVWKKTASGQEKVGVFPLAAGTLSNDGTLIFGREERGDSTLQFYDVKTRRKIGRMEITERLGALIRQLTQDRRLIYNYSTYDQKTFVSSSGIRIRDPVSGELLADFSGYESSVQFLVDDTEDVMLVHSKDDAQVLFIDLDDYSIIARTTYAHSGKGNSGILTKIGDGSYFLITFTANGIMHLISKEHRKVVADFYLDEDGDWAVAARDGRVDGTAGALDKLEWREYDDNGDLVNRTSLDAAFANFFSPGLLPSLLRGDVEDPNRLRTELALAPTIDIVSPASGTETSDRQVSITVKANAAGDPVKTIQLFVNDKLVSTDQRGLKVEGSSDFQTFDIPLVSGRNIIAARAISERKFESSLAQIEVISAAKQASSNLHILAVGVDVYANTAYNLNYAVADASAIVANVEQRAQGIFDNVFTYEVFDDQATRAAVIAAFQRIQAASKPEDVFVFFYAGHGVMSKGEEDEKGEEPDFYLALHDVTQLYGKPEMLRQAGISASELKSLTAAIPAQKQMVLLDACQSGGAVQTFAMRGVAEEKAIIQLARSAGFTLLASTGSQQFATEFKELGHGVFTYAILQGLQGQADGGSHDKKITVKELEAWLNDMVPQLTQKYKGAIQYPRSWSQGMDFPISIVGS